MTNPGKLLTQLILLPELEIEHIAKLETRVMQVALFFCIQEKLKFYGTKLARKIYQSTRDTK
jgi:hypothetical protein